MTAPRTLLDPVLHRVGFWMSLMAAAPALATGQTLYAGAGFGASFPLGQLAGANATYRAFYGAVGIESPGRLGVRLEGTETYGYVWASADLTYRLGAQGSRVQPYGLAGVGARVDVDRADPTGGAGAGVRAKLTGPFFLVGEGRFSRVFSSQTGPGQARTFLFLTMGVSVGPR